MGGFENGVVVEQRRRRIGLGRGTIEEEKEQVDFSTMREALGLERIELEGRYIDNIGLRALNLTYRERRVKEDIGGVEVQRIKTLDEWIKVEELKEGESWDGAAGPPPSLENLDSVFQFGDLDQSRMVEQGRIESTEEQGGVGGEESMN